VGGILADVIWRNNTYKNGTVKKGEIVKEKEKQER
jgi:hypothetical protein